jgi:hypothetical protein
MNPTLLSAPHAPNPTRVAGAREPPTPSRTRPDGPRSSRPGSTACSVRRSCPTRWA